MKTRPLSLRMLAPLFMLAAVCPSAYASLNMDVVPYNAIQFGTGSGVKLGHTVVAGTNLNRLVAGGAFIASCDRAEAGDITGSRTLSSSLIGKRNQLYVTIPDTVPSLRNMPGFLGIARGTEMMCQYNWTAFAEEPTYSIGIPPFSITVGGERAASSGVVTFWMKKPGTATGDDDVCIP